MRAAERRVRAVIARIAALERPEDVAVQTLRDRVVLIGRDLAERAITDPRLRGFGGRIG